MTDKQYRQKLLFDAMALHDPRRARDLLRTSRGLPVSSAVEAVAHREVTKLHRRYQAGVPNERLIRANLCQYAWACNQDHA